MQSQLVQYGLVQDGLVQRGLVQRGSVQGDLVQGGLVQGGLVQGGLVQGGLVQGGLVQRGLVQRGSVQGDLVQGGLVQGGLVQGGLVQGGLVQGGLVQGSGKVGFQSVPSQYPLGQAIYSFFVVPGTYQPEEGDFIGLGPVGWRNVSDFVYQRPINVENIWGTSGQRLGHVVFESQHLPCGIQQGNQYQFVYVRNGSLVQGVSRPFVFVPVNGEIGSSVVGQRSWGIQQWINRLKQVTGGVYGGVYGGVQTGVQGGIYGQQPHYIQYQQGLRYLQGGLEQVLLNEFEGVRSMQQGLQYLQQYIQLVQTLPQTFSQEIRRIQQGVNELEQLYSRYRQPQSVCLPSIVENVIYRQHVQAIQQGLFALRQIVQIPVSGLVNEPTLLRSQIQEIFAGLPVESFWTQQQWEELVHVVGRILVQQERFEFVQRQLEQQRIVSLLRTLWNQQRVQGVSVEQFFGSRYGQLLREILQQVQFLRQREQLHLSTVGQNLVQLFSRFVGQSVYDLPRFRQFVLDLVSGQVLSQVTLRGNYRDLSVLLDEIETQLGGFQQWDRQWEGQWEGQWQGQWQGQCEQRPVVGDVWHQEGEVSPVEYRWWVQPNTVENFGLGSELWSTGLTFNNNVYRTIEQLRSQLNELRFGGVCGGVQGQEQERRGRTVLGGVVSQYGSYPTNYSRFNL